MVVLWNMKERETQMTKHTLGPWHRNIRANGKYPTVFAGRNQHVAVIAQQDNPEETEANIDLIAAAPELLGRVRRLTWLLSEMSTGEKFSNSFLWAEYEQTLAVRNKAMGE